MCIGDINYPTQAQSYFQEHVMAATIPVPVHNMSERLQHTMLPPRLPQPASPLTPKIQPPPTDNVPVTTRPSPSTTLSPSSKQVEFTALHNMSDDLSENIVDNTELLERIGWTEFASLENVHHLCKPHLNKHNLSGAPVRFYTQERS